MKKIQLSPKNVALLAALERGEALTNREISGIHQNLTKLLKFIDSVRFDDLPENWMRDAQTETGRIVAVLEKAHFGEIER